MFDKIMGFVRQVMSILTKSDAKKAFGIEPIASDAMAGAIRLWADMYYNRAPWRDEDIHGVNIPSAIAAEMARLVTLELKSEISGSARADYLNEQYAPVIDNIRRPVEYGAAKGGLMFKPYVDGKKIVVDYIQADAFWPVAVDSSGKITGAVFADQLRKGDTYYTRYEYHALSGDGYTIQNIAYKSINANYVGSQIQLTEVDEWADIEPTTTISGIDRPLFGYFKMPTANTVDTQSPLGVSVYSRAVDLIKDADKLYSELLWEFESGQRAVYASEDAFKLDSNGRPQLPDKRLYRALDVGEPNKLIDVFSPEFREQNIINGLNAILRKIEYNCGLAYGTLSDVQDTDKTAEEIKSSKQRSYATVSDTQKALKVALDDLVYAMDTLATLYKLAPAGKYDISFDFDDSIISDRAAEFAERQQLLTLGVMQPWELRMWYFGETEEQAKKALSLTDEGGTGNNAFAIGGDTDAKS